jgi:biopolymer transport protein TolR
MELRSKRRRMMSEINVVPYIDVMLVLLVIFMVTAPILTQGVLVDLPRTPSEAVPGQEDDPLVVTISADGTVYINLGVRDPEQGGTQVTLDILEDQAGTVIRARPDIPVYVRADHRLEYGHVITVMAILQSAGAVSVGLITEPPDLS